METWNELLLITASTLLVQGAETPTAYHLRKAKIMWFKELQAKHFSEELQFLKDIGVNTKNIDAKRIMRKKKIVASSLCINLNLFLHSDGLIRLYTSLALSEAIDYDIRFPILLPRDDYVTKLLIRHYHVTESHSGIQQTLSSLRLKFWIPKLGKLVPQIVKSCETCNYHHSQRYHVTMSPPLPPSRVSDVDPFTFVGTDMTGHFFVKVGKETVFSTAAVLLWA